MQTEYPYIQVQQRANLATPHLTKRGFLVRISISIAMEAGFAILSAICLRNPVLLDVPLSLSNAKAAFTVISILWQLAATFSLADIIHHCFSSEWYFQLIRTSTLIPGRTDIVSILTSGMLDQLRYAASPRSSSRFRVAFVVALLCIAIRAIVPGSLSPTLVLQEESTKVQVARTGTATGFVGSEDLEATWFYMWLSRAGMIGQLEQQQVVAFGLEPPRGWMVGWPDVQPKNLSGKLRYPTDVVSFGYQCKWENQEFLNQENGELILSPGLPQRRAVGDVIEGDAVLSFAVRRNEDDFRVGFLFTGLNSQTPATSDASGAYRVDLNGLPTFNASGLTIEISAEPFSLNAPVAALLVCDNKVTHSGGEARLSQDGTITVTRSQDPPVGNIDKDPEFLHNVFQESIASFFAPIVNTTRLISIPSFQAFFAADFLAPSGSDKPAKPLPLEEIANNLNGVATSIAKSFSSGVIIGKNFGVPASSLLVDVDGWVEREKLVLAANARIFWIGTGLWVLTACLLVLLGWLIIWSEMKTFSLVNILDALKEERKAG